MVSYLDVRTMEADCGVSGPMGSEGTPNNGSGVN